MEREVKRTDRKADAGGLVNLLSYVLSQMWITGRNRGRGVASLLRIGCSIMTNPIGLQIRRPH